MDMKNLQQRYMLPVDLKKLIHSSFIRQKILIRLPSLINQKETTLQSNVDEVACSLGYFL